MGNYDTFNHREPAYPDDLYGDIGFGFLFGAIYGSTRHLITGIYNSPKGQSLVGASQALRLHAPPVTSRFAVRFGVLGIFETIFYNARGQKQDYWTSIMAGAATGGFLKLRHGVRAASKSTLNGGASLALLSWVAILIDRNQESEQKYVAGKGFPLKEPEATPLSKWSVAWW